MKKIWILTLLLGFAALWASEATIENITGKVQLSQNGSTWQDAQEGDIVSSGTIISTGFRSTAQLNTGSATIHVSQLTRLTLEELVQQGNEVKTTLFLNGGRVNAQVSRETVTQDFTVRSPIATASVRGTGFTFDGKNLWVENGAVLIINKGQGVLALPGDYIGTGDDGTPQSRLIALADSSNVDASVSLLGEDMDWLDLVNEGGVDLIEDAILDQIGEDTVILGLVIQ